MNRYLFVLVWLLLSIESVVGQSVGLVLAGGGAKGIAHIGMIQALEDNDIPIDYITGTSIGAIVGALYAMGYTPQEMLQMIASEDFMSWQTGVVKESDIFYFKKPAPTAEMMTFRLTQEDSSKIVSQFIPSSLINPTPMNFAFMQLFAPHTLQSGGDFDHLFVPFRAIASDIYRKRAVVLSRGDLGDAVRASMSFPFLFKPIVMDSTLMYDGGIYNNFPVDVMKADFAPDIIIGSNVSSNPNKPKENNLINHVENMIIHHTEYLIDERDGILLEYDVDSYGLLDFDKHDTLYKIGYDKAKEYMDSIKGRITRRVSDEQRYQERYVYKMKTPELLFDTITVSGGTKQQQQYIKRQFELGSAGTPMNMLEAKNTYFKLLSDSKIADLIPHVVSRDNSPYYQLKLDAEMDNNFSLGLGAYITSSNSNLIYLGAHYQRLSTYALDLDINGAVGRNYNSGLLSSRIELPSSVPMYLQLMGVYNNKRYYESETLFYADELPTFIKKRELFGKIRAGLPFLTSAKAEITLGLGRLSDNYYQSNSINFATTLPDNSDYLFTLWSLKFKKNTLNNLMYPSRGNSISVVGEAVFGTEHYTPAPVLESLTTTTLHSDHSWLQLTANYERYLEVGKYFTLGIEGEGIISTKGFFNNYTATMVQAPAFTPTPHSHTVFNEAFRANQYLAAGVVPLVNITPNLQLRTCFYGFSPLYKILRDQNNQPYYDTLLNSVSYMGEMALVYNLSFASFSIAGGHYSYPKGNWYFGVNLGLLLYNPTFMD